MERLEEVQIKLTRVRNFLEEKKLKAVLLKTQPNFSWLTGGGLNMVGVVTEMGVTSLLITQEAQYVIANRIEAKRMMVEEGLEDLGFTLLEHEWYEDRELELVKEIVGDVPVGCDVSAYGFINIGAQFKPLRYELTAAEIERYKFLGEKVSTAIERVLLSVKPGDTEAEITGRLSAELWKDRIDPAGYMAAADERARLYRHPIPTMNKVQKYLMLCINARYKGLITTITRLVHFGPVPSSLLNQYRDNVEIECIMIANTRIGEEMRRPLLAGIEAYARMGYHEEWKLHHQGGPMGYYARDIRVTPATSELVRENQAFCWNPTISGTKSEDGFIITSQGIIMITKPVLFPTLKLEVEGQEFVRPGILTL